MTYEEEERLFHKNIAEAIAAWSVVEVSLCLFFSLLLGGRAGLTGPSIVFYAIENFRSKQQVVDALASKVLSGALLEQWKTIDKHLGKRSRKRNKIVHSSRFQDKNAAPGKRIALIDSLLDPHASRDPSTGEPTQMHIHDLSEAILEFEKLWKDILTLTDKVSGHVRPAQ